MYHCVTRINVYSKNTQMASWLQNIPALDHFEHLFRTCNALARESLAESDLIILDLPYDGQNLQLINHCKRPGAIVAVCTSPEELAKLAASDFELIDELWMHPLRLESARFYFSKVMQQLKIKMDLQLNQKYLDGVIESTPDLVWFKDMEGIHLKVNSSFCRTVGKTSQDVQGQSHYYIWDISKEEFEAGKNVCLETDAEAVREKKTCLSIEKVKSREGMRQFMTYKSPILDGDGEPMGTVGIARDITDLWNLKAELEIVLEHIPFPVLFYDNNGAILSANKSFTDYFGLEKSGIVGKDYEAWEYSLFQDGVRDGSEGFFEVKFTIQGSEKILKINKEPVYDIFNNITGHFCIYSDITLEYVMQKRIIHHANTDYLTGLYNRRYMYEYINHNRDKSRICLLCIDLDDFKKINDAYGHTAGDRALVYIAEILVGQFPDQKIFRLGGDEFLVAMSNDCDIRQVEEYANDLLNSIISSADSLQIDLKLSASIGIVFDTDRSVDFDELVRRSDSALYMAKQRGKNQYCIWDEKLQG